MQTTKLDYSSNLVKFNHIMRQNCILVQTVRELQEQVAFHRKLNNEMFKTSPNQQVSNIKDLFQRNQKLQLELMRLVKSNQEYLCQILMKDQLICEINKQHDQIIANYQQKISQLRASVLKRQQRVINIQKKYANQKVGIVGLPTYANLAYFGELNQLRMYIDRLNLQNSQLKYLNALKEQQILNLKKKVQGYELTFKKLDLLGLQDTNTNTSSSTNLQKMPIERINLESQISSYDSNYHEITPKKQKIYSNTNNLRLIITHLNNQNFSMVQQRAKFALYKTRKQHQYCLLQEAYKKNYKKSQQMTAQIEYLKLNIKYMQKYVIIPRQNSSNNEQLQKDHEHDVQQKGLFIDYWKKYCLASNQDMVADRRILSIKSYTLAHNVKRPKSCPSYFKHVKDSTQNIKKQEYAQSFSFILASCNTDTIVKESISKRKIHNSDFFDEDISGIYRPKNNRYANDYEGDLKEVDLQ